MIKIVVYGGACLLVTIISAGIGFSAQNSYDFELYDIRDRLIKIRDIRQEEKARAVAIDFFAVECKACKEALPEWVKLYKENENRGLKVVLVALPMEDDREVAFEKIVDFLKANPVPFPVVFDKYSKVARQFGVVDQDETAKLPMGFLLGRDGKLLDKSGSHKQLFDSARKCLGEK